MDYSGNTASSTYSGGGGVYVYGGTFTMSGGTISGNTGGNGGGGVYVSSGTFTMNGGEISGNTARMDVAPPISGNTAGEGGGVYVYGGTFIPNGGTVSGNTPDDVRKL